VYAPATITNTPARDFSVNVKQDITLVTKKVDLQWNIAPNIATGNTATISLGWGTASQGLQFNPLLPVELAQYNGSSWLVRLATVTGTNPYTATAMGITNFLPFVVANQNVLADETLLTRPLLKIYPTLTQNFLTIETSFEQDFVIINLLGQPVLMGKTRPHLDISQLPQGTYLFKVGAEQVKFTKGF
jgi:hypothetical protein